MSKTRMFQALWLLLLSLICVLNIYYRRESTKSPQETLSQEDKNLQKGKIQVTQAGAEGKEEITYSVTYVNGKEIKKEQISAQVTVEPTTQTQVVGTKQHEEFIWPVPYTKNVTSPYGRRWGTFHYGIDISVHGVDGKEILAATGGTVEKASLGSKGYGNHIIINHNDGTKTLYGHCKSLCVSQGQSVSQGDKIAFVGSTGDSTGPHLHFEVMVNGEKKDPKNYVN